MAQGDGHQFLPVAVLSKSGTPYADTYFAWHVNRRLDGTDPSSIALSPIGGVVDGRHIWSDATPVRNGFDMGHTRTPADRRLLRDVVGDAAVWRDCRYYLQYYVLTDDLFAATTAAQVTGLTARAKCAFA